jgi:hypothetical protein
VGVSTIYSGIIRYSDYNGPQDDVVVRDGCVVPFDRNAAREMAHQAQAFATFMGHFSIKGTFDLYGHLMPGTEAEAGATGCFPRPDDN